MGNTTRDEFDQVTGQISQMMNKLWQWHTGDFCPVDAWTPAINVYRYERRIEICMDLAGLRKRRRSTSTSSRGRHDHPWRPRRLRPSRVAPATNRCVATPWKSTTAASAGRSACPCRSTSAAVESSTTTTGC